MEVPVPLRQCKSGASGVSHTSGALEWSRKLLHWFPIDWNPTYVSPRSLNEPHDPGQKLLLPCLKCSLIDLISSY